jgi:hypothetical protein
MFNKIEMKIQLKNAAYVTDLLYCTSFFTVIYNLYNSQSMNS